MGVTVKNDKATFKTHDTMIRTLDKNGHPTDDGSNNVDVVNNEMAAAMGVSKAILNNVIFCHQEDSAWPLDEGQKLKAKFDSIFGTTEYNKAIEKIIKFRKGYQEKQKLCANDKRHLEETKNDADRKSLDLDILKVKHEKMEAEYEKHENDMIPIDERLEVLLTMERDCGKLQGKETSIRTT